MPSTVTFRGLDVDDVDGIFLEVTRGFLGIPTMRGDDVTVPARAGRDAGDRVADVLQILLEGYVAGDDPEDWRAKTDALLAVLDEDGQDPGTLEVLAPRFGLGTGQSATIAARVKNYVPGVIVSEQKQTWSIELESVDPYWTRTP